ncbi:DUF2470 domain-containing protein [Plantactinospora sp. WMMB334]|uniref:DUF2470 domain-containing protein n=1 Tax=Plantactinospora sp. WMMB334 TaxID=3404119 RepID=UPI003B94CDDA
MRQKETAMPADLGRLSDGLPTCDAVAVRSILASSCSLRLCTSDLAVDLLDAHAVLPDGTVVLAVDAMTPLGGRLVAARGAPGGVRLELTSVVPVPVRCRVRARATITGTARPFDPARLDGYDAGTNLRLLDLPPVAMWAVEPLGVHIRRHSRRGDVAVTTYRAAQPDPVAATEASHLHRLVADGASADRRLLPARWRLTTAPARVVPVAIDADGLTLRAEAHDGHDDVRLPFASRVTTEAELARELALLSTAHLGSQR